MSLFRQLFGQKPKSPEEMVKEYKRTSRSEGRKLDRQINKIKTEEKKAQLEMKKAAKTGNKDVVRILAAEVVQARKAVNRIHTAKAQMNSIAMALDQQMAQYKIAGNFQKSTEVTKSLNRLIRVQEIQETMVELKKEMMKSGMIQEMMDDAVDGIVEVDTDEEDEEISKVMDEVLSGVKTGQNALPQQAEAEAEPEDDELEKRLKEMRAQ